MVPVPTPGILWRQPARARARRSPGDGTRPASASRRPRRRRRGSRREPLSGRCTTRRCRHGPVGASTSSRRSLAGECEWLVANDVLPADVVTRNRRLAETALRPWTPVFIHGDLQVDHVFVAGDEVTGIIDWSEACPGRRAVRPRHPHARPPGAPRRRRRRLRHRRRPRPHPRVVVVAMPVATSAGWPSTATARPRVPRGRRPALPGVRSGIAVLTYQERPRASAPGRGRRRRLPSARATRSATTPSQGPAEAEAGALVGEPVGGGPVADVDRQALHVHRPVGREDPPQRLLERPPLGDLGLQQGRLLLGGPEP